MIWEDSHDIGDDLTAYQNVRNIGLNLNITIAGKLDITICIITTAEYVKKTLGITR